MTMAILMVMPLGQSNGNGNAILLELEVVTMPIPMAILMAAKISMPMGTSFLRKNEMAKISNGSKKPMDIMEAAILTAHDDGYFCCCGRLTKKRMIFLWSICLFLQMMVEETVEGYFIFDVVAK